MRASHTVKATNPISRYIALPSLSLLDGLPWLALVTVDRMQHDLVRVLRRVAGVALAPVVADAVCEDGAIAVEGAGRDGPANRRVALEPVLSHAVPEVKGAVRSGGAERAVLRVEGNGVDSIYVGHVILRRVPVALEGEVFAVKR